MRRKLHAGASVRWWLEMPAPDASLASDPTHPAHAIRGRVLLVYRGSKVYAALHDPATADRIGQRPDVRWLARAEAADFEATLPGLGAVPGKTSSRAGLGDVISWMTRRLRIRECSACTERKERLNSLISWRWSSDR